MRIIVGLLALFAVYKLSSDLNDGNNNQWWSKRFDLAIAISVLLACIITYFVKSDWLYCMIPILLFVSLIGGLIQNLVWC